MLSRKPEADLRLLGHAVGGPGRIEGEFDLHVIHFREFEESVLDILLHHREEGIDLRDIAKLRLLSRDR